MKILIFGILAIIGLILIRVRTALGFSNSDVETAAFDSSLVIPAYRDPTTRQWGQRIADNTGYNWRHSDLGMYIPSVLYSIGTELTYDTGRDYRNKFLFVRLLETVGHEALPVSFTPGVSWAVYAFVVPTTTYQTIHSSYQIKALNTGGYTIKKIGGADRYITGIVLEIRQVTGA